MWMCKRPARIKKPVRSPIQSYLMSTRSLESRLYQQLFLRINEKLRHERELASLETRREELTARLKQIQQETAQFKGLLEQQNNPFREAREEAPVAVRTAVRTVELRYAARRGEKP